MHDPAADVPSEPSLLAKGRPRGDVFVGRRTGLSDALGGGAARFPSSGTQPDETLEGLSERRASLSRKRHARLTGRANARFIAFFLGVRRRASDGSAGEYARLF